MANYFVTQYLTRNKGKTKRLWGGGTMCAVCLVLIPLFLVSEASVSRRGDVTDRAEVGDRVGIGSLRDESFPKIMHQVWLGYDGKEPPQSWKNATKHSVDVNPDFTYRLWSNDDVIDLLTSHYAWFLPVYHSYPYDVERADAARYFIVLHHGGIYLDMDEISVVPISDIVEANRLQRYQCVLPAGTPNGVTNYVIMCKRNSPFMSHLTSQLVSSKGWYGIPYATVMWSTGPRFISGVYDEYTDKDSLYVMPRDQVTKNFRCLFGQSWFSLDGVIIHAVVYPFVRMGFSWYYLLLVFVAVVAVVARCSLKNSRKLVAKVSRAERQGCCCSV